MINIPMSGIRSCIELVAFDTWVDFGLSAGGLNLVGMLCCVRYIDIDWNYWYGKSATERARMHSTFSRHKILIRFRAFVVCQLHTKDFHTDCNDFESA